jgi:hypothetical protein
MEAFAKEQLYVDMLTLNADDAGYFQKCVVQTELE